MICYALLDTQPDHNFFALKRMKIFILVSLVLTIYGVAYMYGQGDYELSPFFQFLNAAEKWGFFAFSFILLLALSCKQHHG